MRRWSRRELLAAAAAVAGYGVPDPARADTGECATPSDGPAPPYCLTTPMLVRVADAAGLAVGEAVLLNVDDANAVIVGRDARGLFARSGICTHACCVVSLCGNRDCTDLSVTPSACASTGPRSSAGGEADVVCPCHGSRFRLSDGAPVNGPAATPLPAYAVTVEGADVVVDTGRSVPADLRV